MNFNFHKELSDTEMEEEGASSEIHYMWYFLLCLFIIYFYHAANRFILGHSATLSVFLTAARASFLQPMPSFLHQESSFFA